MKIYGSKLISSSLWDEAPEVRLTFLALLAIADARGFVDVPNERALARVLNLERGYVERALAVLMAPDKGSRTDAHNGRRVLREGAGWLCVNYEKYREFRSAKQEAIRLRVEKHRTVTRNAGNATNVTGNDVTPEAEADGRNAERRDLDPPAGHSHSGEQPMWDSSGATKQPTARLDGNEWKPATSDNERAMVAALRQRSVVEPEGDDLPLPPPDPPPF